jgi:predicted amidohydrolase
MRTLFLLALSAAALASDWTQWSARPETNPVLSQSAGELRIAGTGKPGIYGGWQRRFDVEPGAWYRFRARYRAQNTPSENWQVVARLDWCAASGNRAGQPDYPAWMKRDGEWRWLETTAQAPPGASGVNVQLLLAHAPSAVVAWRDVTLEKVDAPKPRRITVATINLRPDRTGSAAESVRQFIETIEKTVPPNADLILLPEGVTVVGTGKSYPEVAESIPGPTTESLGEVARKHNAWIAAGIYEREGSVVYNTSVLIDRAGKVAGKYRKVYLPREELERGLTPGDSYPVFKTDFGTVGMMICYDVFFSDPARALAAQGADLILLPIWGGDETLAKARAIENKIFLVASGYDHPTYIMDPDGERLSEARSRGAAAVATIDLEKRYMEKWLGDMRTRRMKEYRIDVAPSTPGLLK